MKGGQRDCTTLGWDFSGGHPIPPRGFVEVLLNGERIEEADMRRTVQPRGRIPSQFVLRKHELVTIALPVNRLRFGQNTLAFHAPAFPRERDPYVYVHELAVDTEGGAG